MGLHLKQLSLLGCLCSVGLLVLVLWLAMMQEEWSLFVDWNAMQNWSKNGSLALDKNDDTSLEQPQPGRRICLGVLTAGRTALNEHMLRTLEDSVGSSVFYRKVIIDDSRDLNTTKLLVDTFGPKGFRVFRTNHPPKIEREFKISLNIWTLYALMNPNLVSKTAWGEVTAYRQKLGGGGGEFNPGPMGFEAKADGSEEVVEHSLVWPSTPIGDDAASDVEDCDYVLHSEGVWGYLRQNFLQDMLALHENTTRTLSIGALTDTLGNSTTKYKDRPEQAKYLTGVKLTVCPSRCGQLDDAPGQLYDIWRSWSNQPGLVHPKVMLMDHMTHLAFLSEGKRAGVMHGMGYFLFELGRERTCSCQLEHLGHHQLTELQKNPQLPQEKPPPHPMQTDPGPLLLSPDLFEVLPTDYIHIESAVVSSQKLTIRVQPLPGSSKWTHCCNESESKREAGCSAGMVENFTLDEPFFLNPYSLSITPDPTGKRHTDQQSNTPRRSVLLVALPGQLHRGIYHEGLNRLQGFSIISMMSSSANYTNVDWIIWHNRWDGVVDDTVQHQSDQMIVFVQQQYNSTLRFHGIRHPLPPTLMQIVMFRSKKKIEFNVHWQFLVPEHARFFRYAILGAPDQVWPRKHLELAFWNRKPEKGRNVPNAEAIVQLLERSVKKQGYTINTTMNDDLGKLGTSQESYAASFNLVITPHGQQGENAKFIPRCGIFIELFGRGAFEPMYGQQAAESGHVVGFVYNATEAVRCGHKGHVLYSKPGQSSRFCVKHSTSTVDPQLVTELLVNQLLAAREACLLDMESFPVVDYLPVFADFHNGAPLNISDFYS